MSIREQDSIFVFYFLLWIMLFVLIKKLCQSQYDRDFILYILQEVLYTYLTFRSIIPFKLNFVYNVKSRWLFFFLPYNCSSNVYWTVSFPHSITLTPMPKTNCHIYVDLFLKSLFYSKKLGVNKIVAQSAKNLPAMQETWVWSLSWEDLQEKEMATHSSIIAWENLMDRRAWWAVVHGVAKSQAWLSD